VHVVATFDSTARQLSLYIDGELVANQSCGANLSIQPARKDLLIGKHNRPMQISHVFEANMFDGIIDELRMYGTAWGAAQVKDSFDSYLEPFGGQKPVPDTGPRRYRYDGDRHRPRYHFLPPQHWMNEPHALLHFKGKYHIMYQHNAHGPFWHDISWGHAVSDDLVHWKDLPDAIVPDKDTVAPDGIWSGSASLDGAGNPVLFITAGNHAMNPNQMTGLARSTYPQDGDLELKNWIVHQKPVTMLDQRIEIMGHRVLPKEFRDPFVWREGNLWCQLVGAGVQDIGGTTLLYTSTDLENWEYKGPFLVGDMKRYPLVSMMWELPVFLPLGRGKHIFLFSPWWSPDQMSAHFLRYVPYWIGVWDAKTLQFTPDHEKPRIFDYGEHFTGPSGGVDAYGRTILLNIAQMKRDPQMSYDSGWDGNAGLPIILFLHDDGHG
jgi:sucrose-6-phosphate hydrolase SacC (GH32 family)